MEDSHNGYILGNSLLSVELIIEIFERVPRKDLLQVQNVCKSWHQIVKRFMWHKDAKLVFEQEIPFDDDIPWSVYYSMSKIIFGRNLIKNHSGGLKLIHWQLINPHSQYNTVAERMEHVVWMTPEFPDDPVFEGKRDYFEACYSYKSQLVDLSGYGFSPKFMDVIQPSIEISVYYTRKLHSIYEICVVLCGDGDTMLGRFVFDTRLLLHDTTQWSKVTHVFRNYGPGVRYVKFTDSGHKFSKSAGTCVKVLVPDSIPSNFPQGMSDYATNLKIWHEIASSVFDNELPYQLHVPCHIYHSLSQVVFGRNLVKNHSGLLGMMHWMANQSWVVRRSVNGNPLLPNDRDFEGQKNYFLSGIGPRHQDVDLLAAGYLPKFLDVMQPPIVVSLWFLCFEGGRYCSWAFLSTENKTVSKELVNTQLLGTFNSWRKVTHVFTNYGPGAKSIRIFDCGMRNLCKIAGISVKVLPPTTIPENYAESFG